MKIGNNRKSFYQWELNQFIVDEDFKIDDEVNFSTIKTREALVVKVKDKNNMLIAEVPNILLQDYHPIYAYWIVLDETGEYVQKEAKFEVIKRPRPQDYVYVETEIWSYSELEQRVKILEKSGTSPEAIGQAVEEYLKENPIEVPEVDLTGVVKSVNGEVPDENGNVEITIPEGGSSGGNADIDAAVAKYLTENPVTGGMTQTEKNLILTLFRNAAYVSGNMNATITQLESLWIGGNVEPDVPVEPDDPTVNGYTVNPVSEWTMPKTGRATTAFHLLEGDKVNFVNADLWNTYKFAIAPGGYHGQMPFIGGGYQAGEVTITNGGTHTVMVARQDDANIDSAEMAVIANSIGYIRESSVPDFQNETITGYGTLQGYPGGVAGKPFTESTGVTTIYFAVNPRDYYEVSRNSVDTNDRFRFAFAATEPQTGVQTMALYYFDGLTKGVAQIPDGANYLMVYVGGTSYPTVPDGFTITRKYKA